MSASSPLPAGSVVGGDFTVVRPIDEGGMGRVYLVEQKSTGKHRALKVMHREIVADASLTKRFEQEARVGARIPSEHVVEVIAAGVDTASGLPYLVMELLEGEDLRTRIDTKGALAHDDVRAVFEQLCHAMAAAHGAGVVHRDLKPENVFLAVPRRAGAGRFTVKVLDFGIAKLAVEAGTRSTKAAVGSPMWMAPEQTSPGPVTPAADVWALGLLAYELYTGRPFWRAANEPGGTTAQLLREVVLDPIPPASIRASEQNVVDRLPHGFDPWFARCTSRDPEDRYFDAGLAWRGMQRMSITHEALAETAVDPSHPPPAKGPSSTGDATPFVPPRLGALPNLAAPTPSTGLPQETPVATVQRTSASPPSSKPGRAALVVGVSIAVAGLATGWAISRRPAPASIVPASVSAPPVAAAQAPVIAPTPTPGPGLTPALTPTPTPTLAPRPALASAPVATPAPTPSPLSEAVPPRPSPHPPLPGGFTDPQSLNNGPTQWKVQDHRVRLLSHLVSNESNVADAVVRKAVEWDAWQYLRCYERAFGGAKDLEEGTVTVGFDILDQLPRHGALQASTFGSKTFNDCVVGTLLGQTINAAGPDGKGHVVYAFRFVPN